MPMAGLLRCDWTATRTIFRTQFKTPYQNPTCPKELNQRVGRCRVVWEGHELEVVRNRDSNTRKARKWQMAGRSESSRDAYREERTRERVIDSPRRQHFVGFCG
jgi:hypothetical protein